MSTFTYGDAAYCEAAERLVTERANFFASMRAARTPEDVEAVHRGPGRRYSSALAAVRAEEDRVLAAQRAERHARRGAVA